MDRGMSPEDVIRRGPRRQFGNPTSLQEQSREMFSVAFLDHLFRDMHYAVRNLGRTPGFAVVAILTIALGIGATTAVFTVVNGVLIKPLPYPDPDSLVGVWHSVVVADTVLNNANHSASMYVTYAENNRTFKEYGVWNNGASSVTGAGDPEQVRTFRVTYGVLRAFGVQPNSAGGSRKPRIRPRHARNDSPHEWLLAAPLGGDPAILGRSITVDSRPRKVIGVMPQSFQLNGNPEIILRLRFNRADLQPTFAFAGIARLKPGVSVAQSNADLQRMLPIWISVRDAAVRQPQAWRSDPPLQRRRGWRHIERPLDPDGRHRIVLLIAYALTSPPSSWSAQTAASRSWLSGLPWVQAAGALLASCWSKALRSVRSAAPQAWR